MSAWRWSESPRVACRSGNAGRETGRSPTVASRRGTKSSTAGTDSRVIAPWVPRGRGKLRGHSRQGSTTFEWRRTSSLRSVSFFARNKATTDFGFAASSGVEVFSKDFLEQMREVAIPVSPMTEQLVVLPKGGVS